MANSHINKLKVVYFIQEYTKIHQKKGVPNTRICRNINVIYPISMGSFYNYMGINAISKLRQLRVNMAELEEQKNYIVSIIPSSYCFSKKVAGTLSKRIEKVSHETAQISTQLRLFQLTI